MLLTAHAETVPLVDIQSFLQVPLLVPLSVLYVVVEPTRRRQRNLLVCSALLVEHTQRYLHMKRLRTMQLGFPTSRVQCVVQERSLLVWERVRALNAVLARTTKAPNNQSACSVKVRDRNARDERHSCTSSEL